MESCEINKKILEKLFFRFLGRHLTNLSRIPYKLKMTPIKQNSESIVRLAIFLRTIIDYINFCFLNRFRKSTSLLWRGNMFGIGRA